MSLQTGSLLVGDVREEQSDVREEQSVDDLDRARLQDFYDELERFRAVFSKAQALVAPMIGEDAGRLEAMGKAIRKLCRVWRRSLTGYGVMAWRKGTICTSTIASQQAIPTAFAET